MKRFVYKLFFFLLPVIILLVVGELYMRNRSNAWSYKMAWMDNNASDVEILIMGGSRMFDGIVPTSMHGKVFNLARDNGLPEYDYFLLQKYLPRMNKLHTIIMQLDEGNIVQNDYEYGGDSYHATYYKVWMKYDKYPWYSKYNFFIYNPQIYFGTIKKDFMKILSGAPVANRIGCDSLGWGGMERKVSEKQHNWRNLDNDIRAKRMKPSEWKCYDVTYKYYCKIAKLCKKNKIRLLLISTPSYPSFVKLIPQEAINLKDSLLNELMDCYGVEYGNYTDNPLFSDDDFFDSVHLSDIGDRKLTELIVKDFKL